ncbi:MAG: hypothetical protein IPH54_07730 [Rhodoferax sp.]|nr:hypothetical protein [Rhodoferax sp.]
MRFTALLHHITPALLAQSFYALRRDAAPGVDAVTWQDYEEGLHERVQTLHRQIHVGGYRATPSRRLLIPKADGRQRALGIASLEDKIVQQAVVTVLNMIYEEDFLGFSYARGKAIMVRYADDSVYGFKSEEVARNFLAAMQERLAKFGLTLNAKKTRLIEFGRFAAINRKRRGQDKPETFDFLGFTHCCSTTRQGKYKILRLTVKKRMRVKTAQIRVELMKRRHRPIAEVGRWLNRVVQGYLNYHAVPGNLYRLRSMCSEIERAWRHSLMRRSQRPKMPWSRFQKIAKRFMPNIRNAHPYPQARFYASHT